MEGVEVNGLELFIICKDTHAVIAKEEAQTLATFREPSKSDLIRQAS